MNNERIEKLTSGNSSATTEIAASRRAYAFENLPKDLQKELLRLQNSDGDFLTSSSGATERRVVLLILAIIASIGLAAVVADSSLDLKRIIVFSVDAFLLSVWLVYLIYGIYKALKTPLKNRIYITPTLMIETLDGTVRYRELKDAGEIAVNKFATNVGRRSRLDVKFDDGDFYRLYVSGMVNSKQIALMQKWQEKAEGWKREAINASKRGDTNYLESNDIFSKSAETITRILLIRPRTRKENRLLLITVVIFVLNGAFIFFTTE